MTKAFIAYVSEILANTNKGFSGSEIVKKFVEYSVKFNKQIKFENTTFTIDGKSVPKREVFRLNLECFSKEEQFLIVDKLCDDKKFVNSDEVLALRVKLHKDYPNLNVLENIAEELDYEIVEKTKHLLDNYPTAKALYDKAIKNYKLHSFNRNVLDDMRLSLESLLKDIFSNNKSLENQIPDLGNYVKLKGGSPEFTNMFQKLIDYYSKYQNTYIKHNDRVNEEEVEFVIELTSIFIKKIIKFK